MSARVSTLEANEPSTALSENTSHTPLPTLPTSGMLKDLERNLIKASISSVKNNVIVRGLEVEARSKTSKLTEFIKANFSIENSVTEAHLISKNKPLIKATLSDATTKNTIMSKKKLLKNGVYFDHDLTSEEEAIASKLRFEARKLKRRARQLN